MNFLSIDVGTTACKCQLFSESGEILDYIFEEFDFKKIDGYDYIDIVAIKECIGKMIREISSKREISSIAVSSLGEAFVLLDKEDNVVFYPMLYTDPRGDGEAEALKERFDEEEYFGITGVIPHSMYSLSKLLWLKNNYPDVYDRADKLLLVCDYIGYILTGERVIDYALASRSGAFDVSKMEFSSVILDKLGIDKRLFSTPKKAGTLVGRLKEEWGIDATLVLGSHDQVCTALGAGAIDPGDAVDGLGTVECITTIFEGKPDSITMGRQGYPCVPFAKDGLYCTYILNYSCGSTVNWLRKKIMHGYRECETDFFTYIERDMKDEPTGILTLPYFGGASTPYQDMDAKGAIVNLRTDTSDSELYRSIMEGTAMEMRLNCEQVLDYGINVKELVATGGGANSDKWMQIKADIQNLPIKVLRSSEGGLCGCAMLQSVALGRAKDLSDACDIFVKYKKSFTPKDHSAYEEQYKKYTKLYKTLKELF